jgi:CHAT domain-containing protein
VTGAVARLVLLLGAWLALACTESPPAATPADALLEAGLAHYADEQFDSAHSVWTVALARARAAGEEPAEARILAELGLAEWRLGNLAEAEARQQAAIDLNTRLGNREPLSRSYNALGLVALSRNRNPEAVRHFDRAIEAARAVGDSLGVTRALGNLALPAAYLGDFTKARAAARGLRRAGFTDKNASWEGNGLSNEAMVDLLVGDPRSAIARLDTARAIYARVGYRTGEQTALGQLASAWQLTGDYDKSFAVLDTALAIARELHLKEDQAINLRLIAELHEQIGDYRRALRFYAQADTAFRAMGGGSEHGIALRGAGRTYHRLGIVARAREMTAAALELHRESGESSQELDDLVLLAELDHRTGGLATAGPRLDSIRALADRIGTRGARIASALGAARIADVAGDSPAVLRELRRVASDLAPGDYGAEWETAALEARAHAREGRLEEAIASGRRSIAAIDRLRDALPSTALKGTLVSDRASVYGDLVLTLLRLDRREEAFGVADAARSRGLLQHLSVARDPAPSGPRRRLVSGEELLRRIDQLVQQLRETERPERRERGAEPRSMDADLTRNLIAARNEYEVLFVRAMNDDPRASALLGGGGFRLEAVQAALDTGQALIEYLVTSERLVTFIVTRERLAVIQSAFDPATLVQQVRLLRDLWGRGADTPNWRAGLAASRALHRTLVAPLLPDGVLARVTDILFVPHGVLGRVPFAALQNDKTGRFLIQDFRVMHLPSAGALPLLSAASRVLPPPGAGAGFAPFPENLPASGPEVEAIRTHFATTGIHLGGRATEPAVRAALANGAMVHVATHGILNGRNPMFSRIELARSGAPGSANDGRLEVHELLGLTIRSPLVFFSGCETGAGYEWTDDPVAGTADLTLAQAVLAGGANHVISTLWRINDAGAGIFSEHFYRRLAAGTVAGAFAEAQRAMAEDPRYENPYYWAGYTLSGSGQSRRPQNPRSASVSP